jgi:cell division protein WhiA
LSFTAEVKDELARVQPECPSCKKAQLAAFIRIEGTLTISSGRPRLEISTDSAAVARLTIGLIHELYNLKTELTVRRSVLHKTHNFLITVPSQIALSDALNDLGILGPSGYEAGIKPELVKNDCCAGAYLRGAFLSSGYLADPRGDFHFELTSSSQEMANDFVALMRRFDIVARTKKRHNMVSIYIKGADHIASFLALVRAQKSVIKLEEIRVIKSVRNDTNRRVNAEIANAHKASDAAGQQIASIQNLLERFDRNSIPDSLYEVAQLRLAHPSASIKELGEYADPPLSKNAVYHRLRRINEMLEEDDAEDAQLQSQGGVADD